MAPPWLHPKISKADAEEKLNNGGLKSGKFLVRKHSTPGKFVLSIVYKNTPTHHMITKGEDGKMTVNGKSYGGTATTLEAMISHLQTKPEGWPVKLTDFVPVAGQATQPSPTKAAGGGNSGGAPWLHAAINKGKAEELLGATAPANNEGRFLVRKRANAENEWILSVCFRGKPTHHMVKKGENGDLTVNEKSYGPAKSIKNLVTLLVKKPAGWPVKLTEYVTKDGKISPVSAVSGAGAAKSSTIGPSTSSPDSKSSSVAGSGGSFIHKNMNKSTAEELLISYNGGAKTDGTFLIRKKGADANSYILSVIYQGKPTHHAVSRTSKGSNWSVNKKECNGVTTLKALTRYLKEKKPWWPVPLRDGVTGSGGSNPTGSPKKNATESAKASKSSEKWLYKDVSSKSEAEARLAELCGDSPKSGMFICWPKSKGSGYIFTVWFKGQATHHSAVESDGSWTVNKKSCDGCKTIKDVKAFLESKKPWWPVKLKIPGKAETSETPANEGPAADTIKPPIPETPANEEPAADTIKPPIPEVATTSETVTEAAPSTPTASDTKKNEVQSELSVSDAPPTYGASTNVSNTLEVPHPPKLDTDLNKPKRPFEGGNMVEVSMVREDSSMPWGFGVATEWLGVGEGHASVVSSITPGSPADGALKVHDIFVQIDGFLVEDSSLAEVKESIFDLDLVMKAMLYRKDSPRVIEDPPALDVELPEEKRSERYKKAFISFAKKKLTKAKVDEPCLKCASIWEKCASCKRIDLREHEKNMKRMLKVAKKNLGNKGLGSRSASKNSIAINETTIV